MLCRQRATRAVEPMRPPCTPPVSSTRPGKRWPSSSTPRPACIAFASNATQALNTAINGLFGPGDHVITTVCEHNSVLRPLYRLQRQGVEVSFVDVEANGVLRYAQLEQLLRPNTRGVVVTGASNVTGNRTDLAFVSAFAKTTACCSSWMPPRQRVPCRWMCRHWGSMCFALPGTRRCLARRHRRAVCPSRASGCPLVVGGSGVHSFDEHHPTEMPTALEAGTLNVPGIAGLGAGVRWLLTQGVEALEAKENALARLFYETVREIPGVRLYGDFTARVRHRLAEPDGRGFRPGGMMRSGRSTTSVCGPVRTVLH